MNGEKNGHETMSTEQLEQLREKHHPQHKTNTCKSEEWMLRTSISYCRKRKRTTVTCNNNGKLRQERLRPQAMGRNVPYVEQGHRNSAMPVKREIAVACAKFAAHNTKETANRKTGNHKVGNTTPQQHGMAKPRPVSRAT